MLELVAQRSSIKIFLCAGALFPQTTKPAKLTGSPFLFDDFDVLFLLLLDKLLSGFEVQVLLLNFRRRSLL